MRNKKGVGSFWTWFVATIVIFVAVVVFLFFAFILAAQKNIGGGDEILSDQKSGSKLAVQRDLFVFLNSEVEFEQKEISVWNLISNYDVKKGSAEDVFDDAVTEFLDENYPYKGYPSIRNVWVKVFSREEIMAEISGNQYPDVFGSSVCDPRFFDRSIFAEQAIADKKIIFCVSPGYFEK